ncbi:MAG: hypothetical protein WC784_00400 [Candidatus Shapirobacteria bacterium]|jgi:hypothetical protein
MPTDETLIIEKSTKLAEQYPYADIELIYRDIIGCSLLINPRNESQDLCEYLSENVSFKDHKENIKLIVTEIAGISVRSCEQCFICQEKSQTQSKTLL